MLPGISVQKLSWAIQNQSSHSLALATQNRGLKAWAICPLFWPRELRVIPRRSAPETQDPRRGIRPGRHQRHPNPQPAPASYRQRPSGNRGLLLGCLLHWRPARACTLAGLGIPIFDYHSNYTRPGLMDTLRTTGTKKWIRLLVLVFHSLPQIPLSHDGISAMIYICLQRRARSSQIVLPPIHLLPIAQAVAIKICLCTSE